MHSNNLVSKYLLEKEIKRYEDDPELMKSNPTFYFMCKKELILINKIQMEISDFCGTIDDVQHRMDDSVILIENPEIIRELIRKSKWYDAAQKIASERINI